jgi:drug/metabolite transporter (DMT)-like permease
MLLVWPASHLLLGEALGPRVAGAVAALILGLWLLAPDQGSHAGSRRGYLWAFACGLCIAAFQLIYKGAVAAGSNPLQLFTVSMATSLPFLVAGPGTGLGAGRTSTLRQALRVRPGLLVFGSAALTASFLLSLFVLQSHGAGWVMTLRNSSVAFAQLFGWALLGERPTARAAAGVALVFADALLLGSG